MERDSYVPCAQATSSEIQSTNPTQPLQRETVQREIASAITPNATSGALDG
jgi:hypothetical protein